MSKKLAIAIDMGAKHNGVFFAKSDNGEIVNKKAVDIVIGENSVHFSKKSRRENRHKDRGIKRRKLAKRLLKESISWNSFNQEQQELILGLMNNRGYTFISTENEFETLEDITAEFIDSYLPTLSVLKDDKTKRYTSQSADVYLTSEFENENELLEYIDDAIDTLVHQRENLEHFSNKKKILVDLTNLKEGNFDKFKQWSYVKSLLFKYGYRNFSKNKDEAIKKLTDKKITLEQIDFEKEIEYINSLSFEESFVKSKKIINDDIKTFIEFLQNIAKEIKTGAKPRKQYLKEIKEEIYRFDFIENKESFFRLVGNISNLQLRVLRKFFNHNSSHKSRYEILRRYFRTFHYKKEQEKQRIVELLPYLKKHNDLKSFLEDVSPHLTIPPYEDMNNRNTYKCNSMLIKPEVVTDEIKRAVDLLLNQPGFELLKKDENGVLEKKSLIKTEPASGDKYIKTDYTYSKYLQRIFDATEEVTTRELNPRNVFKYQKRFERGSVDSVVCFKKEFGEEVYRVLKPIAKTYYKEEESILKGIYSKDHSILTKCNTNTPYKNNAKNLLLKPVYSYSFTPDEADELLERIQNTKGLKTALERVAEEAKQYQNGFYHIVEACFGNQKCINDKEIKTIVKNLDKNFKEFKEILKDKDTYLSSQEKLTKENLKRFLNIMLQTYNILFKDIGGFSKTCKHCTLENGIRSDKNRVIAKRLLSDVAKPIDGMLDMMLDRVAFEISEEIASLDEISELEIILEQNRFEFEENLNAIKRKNDPTIKKYKKEHKDILNPNICPYTGEKFDKGEWDHILPQSKGVHNSKANLIYVSREGNEKKGNKDYTLDDIKAEHLKEIFGKKSIEEIKEVITKGMNSIDEKAFTNFDNLTLNQQIAMRYALFMRGTAAFEKAFELLKRDKLKTFSNGTQKRLVRLIVEKLDKKFPKEMREIAVDSKVIDAKLVSAMRKHLSTDATTGEVNHLFKEEKQESHSHCIDAMVAFYLANSKLVGAKHRQRENVALFDPRYDFEDIYLPESGIKLVSKRKTFINSSKEKLGSYPLFDSTIYSEHYKHVTKDALKENKLEKLVMHGLLYRHKNGKKMFVEHVEELEEGVIYRIDVKRTSDLLYKLFKNHDQKELKALKFLDELRYFTSRKEIEVIFFDKNRTKLLPFDDIEKNIPIYSENLYKAIYKKLQNVENLFVKNSDGKTTLNRDTLEAFQKDLFASKQTNPKQQKRGKKRHKFTLPILGSPKFRIKRGDIWQVLGNKDIATKNYIVDGEIKPIPFFSTNVIPLKISDLIDCLLVDNNTPMVYEVNIDVNEVEDYLSSLKYIVSSKDKLIVIASIKKEAFRDIDFSQFSSNGIECSYRNDKGFKDFVDIYLNTPKSNILQDYIGKLRNEKKTNKEGDYYNGTAKIIKETDKIITLKYTAFIQKKRQIIIKNLK